ncbi:cysteine hydrolase family protein [Roseococcus pinisoli]|uniref:Cysteine hydrolase n=1 Tax=Roseococcus pinisoli TaxID=2835040 RepID=A0ABS5QGY6_9PROT|nr:cysteine hydrolase family protein [Roseococcus pinisoli]MBS7812940.1 cysteine hydrolase [Roseococcus pinisoli]
MTEPKTLLQLAGASLVPPRLAEAALVVIDAQGEYRDGKLPLEGIDPALDVLAGLLGRARAAGALVIHVAHKGRPGGVFDRDAAGGAILPAAAPKEGEAVVEKPLPNAFAQTDLAERLAGRKELVIVGFQTHMCVSSTARAALDLGFRVTIAADACATRALPDPVGGGAISGAEIHRHALAELADRFAIVVPAAALT